MAACPREDGPLLSEAKLQSIMSFLDEMEKSGQGPPASAPQVWRGLQGPVPEEGLGRLEPASEVSTSVMRLQLEVEEKKQAMVLLQRALVTSPPALPPSPCPQLEQVPGLPPEGLISVSSPAPPTGAAARPHHPAGQRDGEGAGAAAAAAEGALRGHHTAAPVLHRPGGAAWEAGLEGRAIRT